MLLGLLIACGGDDPEESRGDPLVASGRVTGPLPDPNPGPNHQYLDVPAACAW